MTKSTVIKAFVRFHATDHFILIESDEAVNPKQFDWVKWGQQVIEEDIKANWAKYNNHPIPWEESLFALMGMHYIGHLRHRKVPEIFIAEVVKRPPKQVVIDVPRRYIDWLKERGWRMDKEPSVYGQIIIRGPKYENGIGGNTPERAWAIALITEVGLLEKHEQEFKRKLDQRHHNSPEEWAYIVDTITARILEEAKGVVDERIANGSH